MADSIKAQQASGQGNHIQASHQASPASNPTASVSHVNAEQRTLKTDIPARLDRLPWSRFHLMVVLALGVTWILDGLEVTIVGAIGPALQNPQTLGLSATEIGGAASAYVSGAVIGALVFGWLTDRHGRRFIFYVTLAVYLAGVLATATSWDALSFAAFRAITGFGIGGEYAAINSAIDELIPARYRGRIALFVNGSFWLGAAAGSGAALILLDPTLWPADIGWRLSFAIGGVLGFGILLMRRHVPESPRWLVTHGHSRTAETTVGDIEARVRAETNRELDQPQKFLEVHPRASFGMGLIFRAMLGKYRNRSILTLTLMVAQAFLFNAVYFTYGLVLNRFEQVPAHLTGLYLFMLCVSNLMGPLLLGSLFDTLGRRAMIAGTYAISGVLLIATAFAFGFGLLTAWTQTLAWMAVFFFASTAASSAYLTASEIFPLETRALAIAIFYALGTSIGACAPLLFGFLLEWDSPWPLAGGYLLAAALMLIAAIVEAKLGIDAEMRSLEDIAEPLSGAHSM